MRGEPLDLDGPYLLGDNAHIHDELLRVFGEIFEGRYRYQMPSLPFEEEVEVHG
jgi:hypothetical protein